MVQSDTGMTVRRCAMDRSRRSTMIPVPGSVFCFGIGTENSVSGNFNTRHRIVSRKPKKMLGTNPQCNLSKTIFLATSVGPVSRRDSGSMWFPTRLA
ncbi:hypothetical protein PDIG_87980 [Penicillium digitatum PHI26]|uniref:Uncharacterized protein n=2 Tax=Penicillium digitatum TaxID=36651 RepID=K9FPP8_PEND2|nr:hypothetical protein PDIP_34000 [Penicillium digitatum Pd1]EKV04713.1 hypothetical protein PDIG_87980 [Penicillium digitatum PHI26]EKV16812.1 hypothetical protein PDIP_34000 [Penicillium digitatum Pd1]